MKRLLCLLFALLLIFAFASCKSVEEASSEAEVESSLPASEAESSELITESAPESEPESEPVSEPDPLESLDMSKVLFNEVYEGDIYIVRGGCSKLLEDGYGKYGLESYIENNEIPEDAYYYLQFDASDVEIDPQHKVADLMAYLEGYGFIEDSVWAEEFFADHANITRYKGEFTVGFISASAFEKIREDNHAMYFAWRTKPEWLENESRG